MGVHFSVNTIRDVTQKSVIDFHYPAVTMQIMEEAKKSGTKLLYRFGRDVTELHVKALIDLLKHNGFTCLPKRRFGRWGDVTHLHVSWR